MCRINSRISAFSSAGWYQFARLRPNSSHWRRMLRCGCPGTIHCRLPSTEPGSFFIQSNSIFRRPTSSYSFVDEPPVHTVFNSCQRLLAVDRDRPAVVEGLRILRRVLTEIKKRTGATDTRLLLLIVPMRESAYSELHGGKRVRPPHPTPDLQLWRRRSLIPSSRSVMRNRFNMRTHYRPCNRHWPPAGRHTMPL